MNGNAKRICTTRPTTPVMTYVQLKSPTADKIDEPVIVAMCPTNLRATKGNKEKVYFIHHTTIHIMWGQKRARGVSISHPAQQQLRRGSDGGGTENGRSW